MAKKLCVGLLFGLLLLGVAGWWFFGRAAPTDEEGYTLAPMEHGRAADVVSATGAVQPRNVYAVGTELTGKVVEVRADFNQEVAEGDLLARIDDRPFQERLRQAELSVQEAQAGLQQAEAARDAATTAARREDERAPEVRRQIDVDEARRQLKGAEAAVEMQRVKVKEADEARRHAEDDLRLTEIRAPVLVENAPVSASTPPDRGGIGVVASDGAAAAPRKHTFTILDRSISVNQMVAPPASGRLFTLSDGLEQLQVEVQVAEGDVARIARGQTADVKGPGADGGPTFAGRVDDVRLTPTNEHGAVFYKAVVDVRNERDDANREWRLRPGMTADVDVLVRVHDPVWKAPAAALAFQPDPALETEAVRAKLAQWQGRKDRDQWRPVWVLGDDRRPWPIFVRVAGADARGDGGVQTAEYTEVLEWDPEIKAPDPKDANSYIRLVIAAPPPPRPFFSMPKLKL